MKNHGDREGCYITPSSISMNSSYDTQPHSLLVKSVIRILFGSISLEVVIMIAIIPANYHEHPLLTYSEKSISSPVTRENVTELVYFPLGFFFLVLYLS